MRRLALAALLAGAGLLALWALASWAQVIDSDACQQACYEQQSACVTVCGQHVDPVECEENCSDQLESCLARCPQAEP